MKRKQFFADRESARAAQAYLVRKCLNSDGEYLRRGAKTDQSFIGAIKTFSFNDDLTLDIELRKFSQLCIDNLTDSQWVKLRTAVRVKRKKENACFVSIDISEDAHVALKRIADVVCPGKSLSHAILEMERRVNPLAE